MIRLSLPGDEAALQLLWQVAFGDPPAVTDAFFSELYRPGDAVVWVEGAHIASAIYLLDAGTLPHGAGNRKRSPFRVSYSYALATLPDHRGRGLGALVTQAAIARSAELGFDCNLICPAEVGLFSYYTRLGYRAAFSIVEGEVFRPERDYCADIFNIMLTNVSDYIRLRKSLLPDSATVYSELFMQYVAQNCVASGGGLYRLELEGQVGCAAVMQRENQLFIAELLPAALAEAFAPPLLSRLDAETAIFRTTPSDRPLSPSLRCRPFVLAAGSLLAQEGYFPFVLD
ncbi:MAG: GNAT family N-acetyltransferase [Oscillospiraceae bacterium]|nr:GNAT family N-acetyltransferase [Oscillospiraceae bacterium]